MRFTTRVSILVLVDEALEAPIERGLNTLSKFQSLFLWMKRSKTGTSAGGDRHSPVSILVLVDEALEGDIHRNRKVRYRFQSLFLWMKRSKLVR